MDRLLELLWAMHDSGLKCIVDGIALPEASRNSAGAYSSLSFRLIVRDGVTLLVSVICYHLLGAPADCQPEFYWSENNNIWSESADCNGSVDRLYRALGFLYVQEYDTSHACYSLLFDLLKFFFYIIYAFLNYSVL